MKLLLLSNSTMPGETYLGWTKEYIKSFLGTNIKKVLFIPYAGISLSDKGIEESWNVYEQKVAEVYKNLGYELYSIHKEKDPIQAIKNAESITIGGGNTFYLVYMLHKTGIMNLIKDEVKKGKPYIGWSAGSNVACPSLKTTNDMPIIEPENFNCAGLIPFQINPHYLDSHPQGHGGETREQRIEEFLTANQQTTVVGLREASLLQIEHGKIELKGKNTLRIFKYGIKAYEIKPNEPLDFLL